MRELEDEVAQLRRDRGQLLAALEFRCEDCWKCREWGSTCAACKEDEALIARIKGSHADR